MFLSVPYYEICRIFSLNFARILICFQFIKYIKNKKIPLLLGKWVQRSCTHVNEQISLLRAWSVVTCVLSVFWLSTFCTKQFQNKLIIIYSWALREINMARMFDNYKKCRAICPLLWTFSNLFSNLFEDISDSNKTLTEYMFLADVIKSVHRVSRELKINCVPLWMSDF